MSEPLRVFVASSSEQLPIVRELAAILDRSDALEVQPWEEGVFELSSAYIESLEKELDRADFAIVVLTADDSAHVRQKDVNLPRDNVIFELGLFTGRLGRERCFFFVDRDSETSIASDLSGVKAARYSLSGKGLDLAAQAGRAVDQMLALKERYKPSADDRRAQDQLWRFSNRLCGPWWERMREGEDDSSALSFLTMSVDMTTNSPRTSGTSYGLGDGKRVADWWSVSTSVVLAKRGEKAMLYYRWQGKHDDTPGELYGGGGAITFDDDALESGRGEFYDTNYAKVGKEMVTRIKHFGLYRATEEEAELMAKPWQPKAKDLILLKLDELDGR